MSASSDLPSRAPNSGIFWSMGILLCSMSSIQIGAALAKHLFPVVGAAGTVALRVGFSALVLLLLRRPWRRPLRLRAALWGYGLVLGLMNLMFYLALRSIPLGIAVALEFCGPLAVALAGSRRWLDVLWVALVVLGLLLLLPWPGRHTVLDPVGIGYALAAGAGWAAYILLGQRAGKAYGADTVAWGSLVATLVTLPIGIVAAGPVLLEPGVWSWGLGVALLSTALPYSLEMMVLTRLPAGVFGTLMSLEPALAAVSGAVLLDEHLSSLQWLAILAIIIASLGAALSATPRSVINPDTAI